MSKPLNQPSITFCFPNRKSGGVSNQFLNIAYRMKKIGYQVQLVDYDDGFMSTKAKSLGINVIKFSEDRTVNIPQNTILIFQAMNPWTIWKNINIPSDTKILFWCCHPSNYLPSAPVLTFLFQNPFFGPIAYKLFLPLIFLKMKKFIFELLEQESLIFIDEPCRASLESYYNISAATSYVPVPVQTSLETKLKFVNALKDTKKISFSWVGRIADFKYSILMHTIIELDQVLISIGKKADFHIIGDGPYLEELKNKTTDLKNTNVLYYGELRSFEIKEILHSKIDISFAMGTSALESASLGIATILLNFSYDRNIRFHYYDWLYKQSGFSVGKKIINRYNYKDNNLQNILEGFCSNPEFHSRKSFEYIKKNHDLNIVTDIFISKLNRISYCYEKLISSNVYKAPLSYRLKKLLIK